MWKILWLIVFFSSPLHAAPKMEVAKIISGSNNAEIAGYVFRPQGAGPFPAVIGMHGCGGLFENDRKTVLDTRIDWAERLVKAGYVLIYPDSYKSRGLGSVCEIKPGELTVRLADQVGDLVGTVDWLASQPFVDRQRISLIGWGTGGTAAMRILDPAHPIHRRASFAAAIAFYPQCDFLLKSTNYTPLLLPTIEAGAADQLAPAAPCKALAARWGSPIAAHAGAYHNFDAPNAPVRKRKYASGVVMVGTNKAARDKSIKATMETLSKVLAAAPAEKQSASGAESVERSPLAAPTEAMDKGRPPEAK